MNRISLLQTAAILTAWAAFSSCSNNTNVSENGTLADSSSREETIKITENTSLLSRYPLITWARKSPVEIGCMFEKEFSYRDRVFNCNNINYVNNGDPCKNTEEYNEGILFPVEFASKVNPLIKDIALKFEHGSLQELSITFKDSLLKDRIQQLFILPTTQSAFPDNVMEISYGENIFSAEKPSNPNYTKWLTIVGFEHVGAGEVDCD